MEKTAKCPQCDYVFKVQCDDREEALKLLLDENKQFLARALSKENEEWDDEAKAELAKILDIMQRINNLYK